MLSRLVFDIEGKYLLNNNPGIPARLHGYIMETIPPDYAEILHTNTVKPFSQYFCYDRSENIYKWNIHSYSEEAYQYIITSLISGVNGKIKLNNVPDLRVSEKTLQNETTYKEILKDLQENQSLEKNITLQFITPTCFKNNKEYQPIPTVLSIFTILIKKWNAFSDQPFLNDVELLQEIIDHVSIVGKDLVPCSFRIGKNTIPAFRGEIILIIKGSDALVETTNALLKFSEYCGMGIKSALGMGGIIVSTTNSSIS